MKAIRMKLTSEDKVKREIEITKDVRDGWVIDTFYSKNESGKVDFVFYVTPYATNSNVWLPKINTFPKLLKFMEDMAAELHLLKEKEIVHLDINLDNILQLNDGKYILSHFGLASQNIGTQTGDHFSIF